jgi:hypothetical protein
MKWRLPNQEPRRVRVGLEVATVASLVIRPRQPLDHPVHLRLSWLGNATLRPKVKMKYADAQKGPGEPGERHGQLPAPSRRMKLRERYSTISALVRAGCGISPNKKSPGWLGRG